MTKVKNHIAEYFKDMVKHDKLKKRIAMAFISNFFIAFGISLFSLSGFGVDPYTSLMLNLSLALNVDFALLQSSINAILLVFIILIAHRGLVGIGTIFNAFLVGYGIKLFNSIFAGFGLVEIENLVLAVPVLLLGIIIVCFGCSLFFTADIGVGAYDALGFMFERKTKIQYRWSRVTTDVLCVLGGLVATGSIAMIFNGNISDLPNVGLGTVIGAFFTGPVVTFFNDKVSTKILAHEFKKKDVA